MLVCASGSGRGGCAMARVFFTTLVLVLVCSVGRAGAEQAEPNTPVVTLRTLVTGTCQEVQRLLESLLGNDVIRSAAEVQKGRAASF